MYPRAPQCNRPMQMTAKQTSLPTTLTSRIYLCMSAGGHRRGERGSQGLNVPADDKQIGALCSSPLKMTQPLLLLQLQQLSGHRCAAASLLNQFLC